MKAILLGKRRVAFTAEDGREITGVTVYLGFDDDPEIEGMVCEKAFLSSGVADYKALPVGKDVEVPYYSRGKVTSIIG